MNTRTTENVTDQVTDEMAYSFHRALSDGAISSDEVAEIKQGLRAALANYLTTGGLPSSAYLSPEAPKPESIEQIKERLLNGRDELTGDAIDDFVDSFVGDLAKQAGNIWPVAWVRFCSDGGISGPLMDSDKRMDGTRRTSGAWTPLILASALAAQMAKIATLTEEIEQLSEARDEAERGPWPEWAEKALKAIRSHTGYDGFDDAEGVDLVEELSEALDQYSAQIDRKDQQLLASQLAHKKLIEKAESVCKSLEHPTESVNSLQMWELREALSAPVDTSAVDELLAQIDCFISSVRNDSGWLKDGTYTAQVIANSLEVAADQMEKNLSQPLDTTGTATSRWDTIETLMILGNVELNQDKDGGFSILLEPVENIATQRWVGNTPDQVVDEATRALNAGKKEGQA